MHYPHQAPKALTKKYLANNQDGWDVIKSKRLQQMLLDYQVYQSEVNMVEVTDDYDVVKQLSKNLKRVKDH